MPDRYSAINKLGRIVARLYSGSALIIINTLVAFMLLNLALAYYFPPQIIEDKVSHAAFDAFNWLDKFTDAQLADIYPGMTRAEVADLLRDTWLLRVKFDPWTLHRSEPYKSKHLNVLEAGYRSIGEEQGPWPISKANFNVFVFGGSTTLGPGVSDHQTVPAMLQPRLQRAMPHDKPVKVYNFGVGAFFLAQERTLFERLLLTGHKPDVAVFIDGLNDFGNHALTGEPVNSEFYRALHDENQAVHHRRDAAYHLEQLFRATPLGRAVMERPAPQDDAGARQRMSDERLRDPTAINAVIERYYANVRLAEALAKAYGVQAAFIWQPIPFYEYPSEAVVMSIMGRFQSGVEEVLRSKFGYPVMRERVEKKRPSSQFHWCADIQRDTKRILYIDHVHYSAHMSGMLAECIADKLLSSGRENGNVAGPR